ncbi:MAG: glycosyltransferase [Bacteroidota bacterium]
MLDTVIEFLKEPLNVVFVVFCMATLVQLFYIFRYYLLIPGYSSEFVMGKSHPVSVIICAKNEVKNLQNNLPAILEQKYKDFEVIVVDDGSEDNTLEVLHGFKQKYKHLKFTSIAENNRFTHGKKLAITVGIKAAKNEWLLFTDADCAPASEYWISGMQQAFTDEAEIVLGYGGYRREKGLLNLIIRFDTMVIAINYLSAALARMPYMGVGRNMAYRKQLFFKNKGFANHYHLLRVMMICLLTRQQPKPIQT